MNFVISFGAVLSLLCGLSVQDFPARPCSDYQVSNVKPFTSKWLDGVWFLQRTYDVGLPLHKNDCIKFVHKVQPDGNIRTGEISKHLSTRTYMSTLSRMNFETKKNEGYYIYEPKDGVPEPTQIVARGTGFYIEFICIDQDGKAVGYVGIFTKERFPDDATLREIKDFLELSGIGESNLRKVNQVDC